MELNSLPNGFLEAPKLDAQGKLYTGRFVCPSVQWIGTKPDIFCTFTVTAAQIADAAEGNILWTDQAVQRGMKPGLVPQPARELSLSDGYPNSNYVFDAQKTDEISTKLLEGERLFLSPLIWNLRPGSFSGYWDEKDQNVLIYSGRIYLPDSHHRHQAILKAVRLVRDAPRDYPKFSETRQFKIELYFLSKSEEGDYFFEKNQLPKPVAQSKAFDLSTVDDLSVLAKSLIEKSRALTGNVNRVTDRLTNSDPSVMTLSTLREMMRTFAASDEVDPVELEGLAAIGAEFFDLLATIRPELGHLSRADRRNIREVSLVASATMMHGYAALMREYSRDVAREGRSEAIAKWTKRLENLGPNAVYADGEWRGDIFDKSNPTYGFLGITKSNPKGSTTVLNTGAARAACQRLLRNIVLGSGEYPDLKIRRIS